MLSSTMNSHYAVLLLLSLCVGSSSGLGADFSNMNGTASRVSNRGRVLFSVMSDCSVFAYDHVVPIPSHWKNWCLNPTARIYPLKTQDGQESAVFSKIDKGFADFAIQEILKPDEGAHEPKPLNLNYLRCNDFEKKTIKEAPNANLTCKKMIQVNDTEEFVTVYNCLTVDCKKDFEVVYVALLGDGKTYVRTVKYTDDNVEILTTEKGGGMAFIGIGLGGGSFLAKSSNCKGATCDYDYRSMKFTAALKKISKLQLVDRHYVVVSNPNNTFLHEINSAIYLHDNYTTPYTKTHISYEILNDIYNSKILLGGNVTQLAFAKDTYYMVENDRKYISGKSFKIQRTDIKNVDLFEVTPIYYAKDGETSYSALLLYYQRRSFYGKRLYYLTMFNQDPKDKTNQTYIEHPVLKSVDYLAHCKGERYTDSSATGRIHSATANTLDVKLSFLFDDIHICSVSFTITDKGVEDPIYEPLVAHHYFSALSIPLYPIADCHFSKDILARLFIHEKTAQIVDIYSGLQSPIFEFDCPVDGNMDYVRISCDKKPSSYVWAAFYITCKPYNKGSTTIRVQFPLKETSPVYMYNISTIKIADILLVQNDVLELDILKVSGAFSTVDVGTFSKTLDKSAERYEDNQESSQVAIDRSHVENGNPNSKVNDGEMYKPGDSDAAIPLPDLITFAVIFIMRFFF